jgi:hypothetical protein
MPGWLQGICIIVLFLIVRRIANRPDRSAKQRKPRRRTVESICRKMKIPVDERTAYCLLCHCTVARKEAESESLRTKSVKPMSESERMVQAVDADARKITARNKAERDASAERIRKASQEMERMRAERDSDTYNGGE